MTKNRTSQILHSPAKILHLKSDTIKNYSNM